MAALDDLKASIAALADQITASVSEIETLLGKITAPGASDADIGAAAAQIQQLTAALKTEVDKAKSAAP